MVKLNMTFPEGFFEEEERCGHVVSAEMKKVWAVELDLLNEFMRVCNKHGIKYWADGGTLLGAVRHKGYIPWDDDVDISMMREDFDKFCKIAPKEFKEPYFLQTKESYKGYTGGIAKLRNNEATKFLTGATDENFEYAWGLFIDIFPLDNIPEEDDKDSEKLFNTVVHYQRRFGLFRGLTLTYRFKWRFNLIKLFAKLFLHLLAIGPMHNFFENKRCFYFDKYTLYYNKYIDECKKLNGIRTKRICKVVMAVAENRVWPRDWFNETVYLPFEMFQLPAPKEYIQVLDKFYGNWRSFVKRDEGHVRATFNTDIEYIGGTVK